MASCLLFAALSACGGAAVEATGPLAPASLMRDVAALADPKLEGRMVGSEGERTAARYVASRLTAIGLAPVVEPFSWGAHDSANVYAVLPGATDEVIVVGAHLDHLGIRRGALYPGADDNASGVALVLALAEHLAHAKLQRTVIFAFFGAEEEGMVGSRYFVAHPPISTSHVAAMVNIDMIARPLLDQTLFRAPMRIIGIDRDAAVGLIGARRYPALRALADAAVAEHGGGIIVAAEDLPGPIGDEVERQSRGRSDYYSFEEAGIPALFFGDGESRDYHRPSDTIDKLDPELLARRTAAIERVVVALTAAPAASFAASDLTPPKRSPPGGWYLPLGFSTGAAFDHAGTGALLGGELSAVYLDRPSLRFAGIYADTLHDGAVHATRISLGPELGAYGIGVDGGFVVETGGHRGGVARLFASASVLSLSFRAGWLTGERSAGGGWFGELGVQLKFPFELYTRR